MPRTHIATLTGSSTDGTQTAVTGTDYGTKRALDTNVAGGEIDLTQDTINALAAAIGGGGGGDFALTTDAGTPEYCLLKLVGGEVVQITDNSFSEIPNGIFAVGADKPTSTTINVVTNGPILTGFSGLTQDAPYFVSTSGGLTTTPPATGVVQQIGFALSTTSLYVNLYTPMIRA